MKLLLNQYRTVEDIGVAGLEKFTPPLQSKRRSQIKIAVIDDQPFDAGRNLRNYGYVIDEVGDLKNISEVAKYPIILCDLKDVGVNFDSASQGASIIKEIRKNYPAALVAAYSGSSSADPLVKKAKQYADGFIRKDAEMDTWTEELDDFIAKATDTREIWHRTRMALVQEGVNTKTLLKLEDAYVSSINTSDPSLEKVKLIIKSEGLGGAVSNIVQGLVASGIFALIAG